MALKRIDLFMPPLSQYGVLHYFTKKFFEALQRTSLECRLLESKRDDPRPFLEELYKNPPNCTLSFNGLLPDNEGRFFCDMIGIPHVACLVDSPSSFTPLIKSPLTIISCVDRFSCDFFRGLGFQNVFFLPHGVDRNLTPDPNGKREYEVVMLSSCIDYEAIRESWKKKYPAPLCKVLDEAAEITLTTVDVPYYQAFVEALDRHLGQKAAIDPEKIDFIAILDELETYIKGKDRIELIKAVKDAKVDIFGAADGHAGWMKYLGQGRSNIKIHDPIPFEQALEIIKHSKILLNSSPWIKNGIHERVLMGLACETLVITNENIYLKEHFKEGESLVFYQPGKYEKANHRINEYLEDAEKRIQVAAIGRGIVMKHHTWDNRAATLIQELNPILERLKPNLPKTGMTQKKA